MTIKEYANEIDTQYQTGKATEHSYRGALQKLLQDALGKNYTVTNEPSRVSCGAPDYIITENSTGQGVFYVEAKDIGDVDLDGKRENREQFDRYKKNLSDIIFTDYMEMRVWRGESNLENVRLLMHKGKRIVPSPNADEALSLIVSLISDAKPEEITSAKKLAEKMAMKARLLRDGIKNALSFGVDSDLKNQLETFREMLIANLSEDKFADIYAQTITYGMFAARLHDTKKAAFTREGAASLIPQTNPFLRKIFQSIAGYDLDKRIAWIVDDIANIFSVADLEKIMAAYSSDSLHHDPTIHFYEDFLAAYNPAEKERMGVYYTPVSVVKFIVKSVDKILQNEFGMAKGLADSSKVSVTIKEDDGTETKQEFHKVQILDPATGTGTFLSETIANIYEKFSNMKGMWQSYVSEHLISRLHGFEILMASYAVAHIKTDMILRETGFDTDAHKERLNIYLTDALEEHTPEKTKVMAFAKWLSDEANAANKIKRDVPVMVMMGNPPYNGASENKGKWIMRLMEDYKKEPRTAEKLKEKNIKWLDDDYVKFIRLAQEYICRNGEGIFGYICPHGFLDNPTFRGMRWNLLNTFDKIYTLNLHGNNRLKEKAPDGTKDENVFDIMQGVSINIFVRAGNRKEIIGNRDMGSDCELYYADLYGLRKDKYEFLSAHDVTSVEWKKANPSSENGYSFVPKDEALLEEWNSFFGIDELMSVNGVGVRSHKDFLAYQNQKNEIKKVVNDFKNLDENEIKTKYGIGADSRDWKLQNAQENVMQFGVDEKYFQKVLFRPFDEKWTYYTDKSKGFLAYPVYKLLHNMLSENIAIITCRQGGAADLQSWNVVFATDKLVDLNIFRRGGGNVFPLYLYEENLGTVEKRFNMNESIVEKFGEKNMADKTSLEEEIFYYIYGVLHSHEYRKRYHEFLETDFPRVPYPKDKAEFYALSEKGKKLCDLHLMRGADKWQAAATFPVEGTNIVEKAEYKDGSVWINGTQYFGGVSCEAWNFFIGGYQVAEKWLKDRKNSALSFDDVSHYINIIYALEETTRLL